LPGNNVCSNCSSFFPLFKEKGGQKTAKIVVTYVMGMCHVEHILIESLTGNSKKLIYRKFNFPI
jgi:hypothetical protein